MKIRKAIMRESLASAHDTTVNKGRKKGRQEGGRKRDE